MLRGQRSDLLGLLRPVPPPPGPSAEPSGVLGAVTELLADQQARVAQHQQRQQQSQQEQHQQLAVRLLDKLGTQKELSNALITKVSMLLSTVFKCHVLE